MPNKMVTCSKDKAVLVAVLVETPRKRTFSSNHHHHHHHIHLHQPKHGGGGYNRRAQLLDYSRHLRESARSGPSPKPVSTSNQQPLKQITAVGSKPKNGKVPACLGNCKIGIPSFLRSLTTLQAKKQRKTMMKKKTSESESTATKMKSVMKRLQVQKKGGILSKLLAALQKHR